MKFDKVIYFRYIPLTQKIFHDFYMNDLVNSGIDVEYWDLSDLFFKDKHGQEDTSHLIKTIKFKRYQDVEDVIRQQNINKTLFVSIVSYEGRIIQLYRLLTKYNCKLAVFGRNMLPITSGKRSFFRRFIRITPQKVINSICNRIAIILKHIGIIKNYDIIFIGGNKGWQGLGYTHQFEIDEALKVKINSDDYDNALKLMDTSPIINSNYVLFLDEYLPLHPDSKLFNEKSIDCDLYFFQLNNYFNRVEKQFNMPVIIAAHPKAIKYKEKDFFNGRNVYFGQSLVLSRDAQFVLAHDSTSINFPVIFNTPLHFITSRSIENDMYSIHQNIINFAKYLKCNWQYFDNENEPINLVGNISFESYLGYKYDFMCWKDTENKQTSSIFLEFLYKYS